MRRVVSWRTSFPRAGKRDTSCPYRILLIKSRKVSPLGQIARLQTNQNDAHYHASNCICLSASHLHLAEDNRCSHLQVVDPPIWPQVTKPWRDSRRERDKTTQTINAVSDICTSVRFVINNEKQNILLDEYMLFNIVTFLVNAHHSIGKPHLGENSYSYRH